MDMTDALAVVFRWLHIIPAVLLAGGILFWRWVLAPEKESSDSSLLESQRRRWSKLVMVSILFLLVSGLYNAAREAIQFDLEAAYLTLLTIKIVLALAAFALVSLLGGRSETAARLQKNEGFWLDITCLILLAIICIGGILKTSDKVEKVRDNSIEEAHLIEPLSHNHIG